MRHARVAPQRIKRPSLKKTTVRVAAHETRHKPEPKFKLEHAHKPGIKVKKIRRHSSRYR